MMLGGLLNVVRGKMHCGEPKDLSWRGFYGQKIGVAILSLVEVGKFNMIQR